MEWKIKSDLQIGKSYGANNVVSNMLKEQGKIFEADECDLDGLGYFYKGWWYTREMVEPVVEEFKTGDMIVPAEDGIESYAYLGRTSEGYIITVNNMGEAYDKSCFQKVFIWRNTSFKLVKPPEPVDTTVEVTMSDIAKAMNINIDDLKIINGDK